jgi:uncharacterized protein YkwD
VRAFRQLALVCIAAAVLGTAPVASAPTPASLLAPRGTCGAAADRTGLDLAVARRAILCLTNYARVRAGLRPFAPSPLLDRAARVRLTADVRCGEFSHTPCGRPFSAAFAPYLAHAADYRIAENIAWGVGRNATPRTTMDSWLRSPEHRANILSPVFRELGVGYLPRVKMGGWSDSALWSQEFGVRSAGRR